MFMEAEEDGDDELFNANENDELLRSSYEGHMGDVLASEGVEGRGKLRKASGSR